MELSDRLNLVQQRIGQACQRSARPVSEVQLMAVSKNQLPDAIDSLARLGVQLFGENRVQEARAKIPLCSNRLEWHLIGHLQSNKCRDAVRLFRMIHSVDSLDLATEINSQAEKQALHVPILLEVNVAGESTKFGWPPDRVIPNLSRLLDLKRLELHGLMTIAPYSTNPERARPYFKRLRELKIECEQALGFPLPILSMGMSGDFEVAIEEGSTLVRVGTALFGERPKRRSARESGTEEDL